MRSAADAIRSKGEDRLRTVRRALRFYYDNARPLSLRRMARREKAKLATETRLARLRRERVRPLVVLLRDEFSFIWLLVVFAVPFLPWDVEYNAFSDPSRARDFLGAAWQVQGAALGLSLAVVLFVFQSVYGTRLGGSLREFAEETWLFPIFYAGVYGLGLDGLVLLNGGNGAPGGWAATWAASWAAVTGALLIFLFVSTIRAIEPRALHRLRLRRTRLGIERQTEDVIYRRIALALLDRFCKENEIEFFSVFGERPSRTAEPIRARKSGGVRDIRLRRLRKLGREASSRGLPKPRLRVEIGAAVRRGSELLWAEPALINAVRNLQRAFKVRSRDEQAFREILDELHDDAVRAIATPSPADYAEIAATYEGMLLVLPETWARYGQRYVAEVAGEDNPFTFGFTDFVERNLYEEMTQAALGASRDIAHDALDLPIQVALRALDLRALALSGRMMTLWGAAQRSVMRQPPTDERDALLSWARLRLHEYSMRPEHLVTSDESDDDEREFGKDALLQTFDVIAGLAKESLDVDRSDTTTLVDLNRYWDEALQLWNPEHADPQEWHVRLGVERGAPEEEIESLRERLAHNEARIATKRELDDWRAVHRLGLLFWILRNVREADDGDSWLNAWGSFSGYFGDVRRLASILDKAIEADFNDRGRWSNWVVDTMRSRTFQGLAIDFEFIQTFVVLALALVSPDGPPPEIEPLVWGRGRLDNPAEIVKSIVENENLKPLLPDDRLDERAQVLTDSLERMNVTRREREEERLIAAPLDEARVQEFIDKLRDSWRSYLLVRPACAALGTLETLDGEPPTPIGAQVKAWEPKFLFVKERLVSGGDRVAEEAGRALADWDMQVLLEQADGSPAQAYARGDGIGDVLRAAIAELRRNGFEPSLVIVPNNWELFNQLDLQLSVRRGGTVEPPTWLPDEPQRLFLGTVAEVPVIEHYLDRNERVYVLDLGKFGQFREWLVDNEANGVTVEITRYDAEASAELLAKHPEWFDAEKLTAEERVKQLQQQVHLSAVAPFEFQVVESEAARVIDLPDELRDR